MRRIFSVLVASTALVLVAGPSLAKEKTAAVDLAPLLDGLLDGCAYGEPLYELVGSLRPTTRDGGTLAVPEGYEAVVGEPTHETEVDGTTQLYFLPLPGEWRGEAVAGIDLASQDDAGLFVIGIRFVGAEDDVAVTFDPLVVESQAILEQDEMALDFGHRIALGSDDGVTRLICDLTT